MDACIKLKHQNKRRAYRQTTFSMETLFQLSHSPIFATDPSSQLLEHTFLFSFPVSVTSFFEGPVEVLLCFSSTLLDCRYEILFVGMA